MSRSLDSRRSPLLSFPLFGRRRRCLRLLVLVPLLVVRRVQDRSFPLRRLSGQRELRREFRVLRQLCRRRDLQREIDRRRPRVVVVVIIVGFGAGISVVVIPPIAAALLPSSLGGRVSPAPSPPLLSLTLPK